MGKVITIFRFIKFGLFMKPILMLKFLFITFCIYVTFFGVFRVICQNILQHMLFSCFIEIGGACPAHNEIVSIYPDNVDSNYPNAQCHDDSDCDNFSRCCKRSGGWSCSKPVTGKTGSLRT